MLNFIDTLLFKIKTNARLRMIMVLLGVIAFIALGVFAFLNIQTFTIVDGSTQRAAFLEFWESDRESILILGGITVLLFILSILSGGKRTFTKNRHQRYFKKYD